MNQQHLKCKCQDKHRGHNALHFVFLSNAVQYWWLRSEGRNPVAMAMGTIMLPWRFKILVSFQGVLCLFVVQFAFRLYTEVKWSPFFILFFFRIVNKKKTGLQNISSLQVTCWEGCTIKPLFDDLLAWHRPASLYKHIYNIMITVSTCSCTTVYKIYHYNYTDKMIPKNWFPASMATMYLSWIKHIPRQFPVCL